LQLGDAPRLNNAGMAGSPLVYALRLQPLDERWLDDVAELVADPQVRRFTRIPEPPPQAFARSWIDKYGEGRRDGTCEGFAVVDGDGRFVGLGWPPRSTAAHVSWSWGTSSPRARAGGGSRPRSFASSPIGHSRQSTRGERF
jgi:Acetyltransferase (GNAT) domain